MCSATGSLSAGARQRCFGACMHWCACAFFLPRRRIFGIFVRGRLVRLKPDQHPLWASHQPPSRRRIFGVFVRERLIKRLKPGLHLFKVVLFLLFPLQILPIISCARVILPRGQQRQVAEPQRLLQRGRALRGRVRSHLTSFGLLRPYTIAPLAVAGVRGLSAPRQARRRAADHCWHC